MKTRSRYRNKWWWLTLAFYFATFITLLELGISAGAIALGFMCVLLADVAVLRHAVEVIDHNTHVLKRHINIEVDGRAIADAVRRRAPGRDT